MNSALSLGGIVGILISGGFLYWQVGKYAFPQVPQTLFDERKEFIAYAVGLFVGILLSLPFLFLQSAFANGALISILIDLLLLVMASEVAPTLLLQTHYFRSPEMPFYGLAIRAGSAGILSVAVVASSLLSPVVTGFTVGMALIQSLAILGIFVAVGLLSFTHSHSKRLRRWSMSLSLLTLGFVLVGAGSFFAVNIGILAATVTFLGSWWLFFRIRDRVLNAIPPVLSLGGESAEHPPSAFRRLDALANSKGK